MFGERQPHRLTRVHGMSAWDLKLEGATQKDLLITREGQPEITRRQPRGGPLHLPTAAQRKIRHVIDTIGKEGVLLL